MFKNILKRFGVGITKEEKIERAKKKYKGVELKSIIFKIEGVDEIKNLEERYLKAIDICSEHNLYMTFIC